MQPGQPGAYGVPTPPPPQQPVKKGVSIWVWVLGGLLAIFLLIAGAVVVGGLYLARTVKEAASNPAKMAALLAKANPDIEVLDVDESRKSVRIKDKKSGEVLNVTLDDLMQGKITVSKEGGRGGSETSTIQFGGKANLPDFVPRYPGVTEIQGLASGSNLGGSGDHGSGGAATFKTSDDVNKVKAFYEAAFQKSGMKVDVNALSGEGAMIVAKSEDDRLHVSVTLGRSDNETSVMLTYGEKK